MSKFWITCAFIETIIWTILVPYLIWQQWGWIPAVILLAWWLLGYWRVWITGILRFRRIIRTQFREKLDEITDPTYYDEDDTEELPNLDDFDDECHKWIDEGGK